MFRYYILVIATITTTANASDGFYGGKLAQGDFECARKSAMQYVRENSRQPLEELCESLSQLRFDVAKKNTPQMAANYLIKREDELAVGHTTPLNTLSYAWLRSSIRNRIEALHASSHINQWIANNSQSSRYRLRILKPLDWPLMGKVSQVTSQKMVKCPQHMQHLDAQMAPGFEAYYFDAFMKRGCFRLKDETKDVGCVVDQSELDMTITAKVMFAAMNPLDPRIQMEVFILETQHKINGQFLPGYGFIGSLNDFSNNPYDGFQTSLSFQTSLMTLYHPPRCFAKVYFEEAKKHWQAALAWDKEDEQALINHLGAFHFYWDVAMRQKRGSAALGEWLAEGAYQAFGRTMELNKQAWPSLHDGVFNDLTLESFIDGYRKNVKVIKLDTIEKR